MENGRSLRHSQLANFTDDPRASGEAEAGVLRFWEAMGAIAGSLGEVGANRVAKRRPMSSMDSLDQADCGSLRSSPQRAVSQMPHRGRSPRRSVEIIHLVLHAARTGTRRARRLLPVRAFPRPDDRGPAHIKLAGHRRHRDAFLKLRPDLRDLIGL